MRINSISTIQSFKGQEQNINFDASTKKKEKKEKKYVDPLANWPMRGLGYTNDIGVAINEIAPTAARLFWVPALMYFGADVYDKYKNKGNKYDPNAQRAFSQAVFQAFASIILPTVFGHLGQSAFSLADKFHGEKLSTNAKEQTFRFINNHIEEHKVFDESLDRKDVMNKFEESFNIFYDKKQKYYSDRNIFVKLYDKTLANCKRGAIATSNKDRLKAYAKKEFEYILENCNNHDLMKKHVDKRILKLKSWKSLGSFAALLLTVKPIDMFTENIIIKKCIEPQMQRFNAHDFKISDFGKKKESNQTPASNQSLEKTSKTNLQA